MPPGATDWHLPSAQTPMIWEGLSDQQLCEVFKNPTLNGHRTVGEIVQAYEHSASALGVASGRRSDTYFHA
jgi:hypothetical protein